MMKNEAVLDKENRRLKALEYYDILDSEAEANFDRLTLLASEICETPISLVSLIDGKRQWFKSRVGLEVSETPREISFCQHAILSEETFEIENALDDSRFFNNQLVLGDPQIRFYAGHPLTDKNGYNLGTLCVIDRVPRKLNSHQRKALQILAKEVVEAIQMRKDLMDSKLYEKFFNLSLGFMCVINTSSEFKIFNPTFKERLGYEESELKTMELLDLVHKLDRSKTIIQIHQLKKGHKCEAFENRILKKDGTYLTLKWMFQSDAWNEEIFASAVDVTVSRLEK